MRSTGKPPFRTSSLVASGNGMIAVGGNVYVNGKRVPKSDHAQLRGSGRSSTETRDCSHFHAVRVSGVAEVTLALGDPHVSVTFDDNLLACVVTGVESGVLTIATRGNWSAESTPRVVVRCPTLNSMVLSGAARVSAEQLRTAELGCSLSGASVLRATGSADFLKVDLSGSSSLDVSDLRAIDVDVLLSGASTAHVCARRSLCANLSGAGSLRVDGQPPIRNVQEHRAARVSFST